MLIDKSMEFGLPDDGLLGFAVFDYDIDTWNIRVVDTLTLDVVDGICIYRSCNVVDGIRSEATFYPESGENNLAVLCDGAMIIFNIRLLAIY